MAEVWEAVDESLQRTVALKVILEAVSREPTFAERFVREARTIAGLEHPNILPVYDFGQAGDVVYLVMPLVTGGSLKERLGSPVLASVAVGWISGIASALDYAHARGILHRDVKPANVLLDQSGRAMLSDFGLAKSLGDSTAGLTATGAIMGTPTYMSPEQAMALTLDGRSDQYSLGIIAFQLFAGVVPFTADSPLVVLRKHLQEPPPPASRVNPRLTPAIDRAIERALAKNPAERYARCEDLARTLAAATRDVQDSSLEMTRASGSAPAAGKTTEATALSASAASAPGATVRSAAAAAEPYVTTLQGPRRRTGLLAGVAIAVLALAAAAFFLARRAGERAPSSEPASPVARAAPPAPTSPPAAAPAAAPAVSSPAPAPAPSAAPASNAPEPAVPARPQSAQPTPRPKTRPTEPASPAPPSPGGEAWSEAYENGQRDLRAGNYRAAEASLRAALGKAERFGTADPRLSRTQRKLGATLASLNRFPEAEQLLRKSITGRHTRSTDAPAEIGEGELWLGFVLSRQGKARGEAETLIQRALAAREKALGGNDPAVAFAAQQLGFCYEVQGRYAEARRQLERALSIVGTSGNELLRAGILNDLGLTAGHQGEARAAQTFLRQALEIRRRLLGPGHPLIGASEFSLAEAKVELQNYAEAESLLKDALAIREKALGPHHPMTAATLNGLVHVLRLEHRDGEANRYQARARAVRNRNRGGD